MYNKPLPSLRLRMKHASSSTTCVIKVFYPLCTSLQLVSRRVGDSHPRLNFPFLPNEATHSKQSLFIHSLDHLKFLPCEMPMASCPTIQTLGSTATQRQTTACCCGNTAVAQSKLREEGQHRCHGLKPRKKRYFEQKKKRNKTVMQLWLL